LKSDLKVPVSGLCNLSPELLLNVQITDQEGFVVREDLLHFGADMWAIGCVMFTILAGYAPFDEDGVLPTLFRIFKTFGTPTHLELIGQDSSFSELAQMCPNLINQIGAFPQWESMALDKLFANNISGNALDLLTSLLKVEPSHRISASDALRHPFFT